MKLGVCEVMGLEIDEPKLGAFAGALNACDVAVWRTLDTSSIARLFPFSPPDLDTRRGTLYGIDMRACAPVVYDPWDGTHLNANTAVLARSGSGKSFATKLGVLRGITRGVTAYVIDPEGEYADMARAAGGRVLSPGIPGQGMNPFVIDKGDSEELLQRIGSLRRLIEVMVGERLSADRRASLDHALAGYYAKPRERTGFRDFYAHLEGEANDLSRLLRPFATGSLRNLLSDEGDDLLGNEALVTVFDLRLLEPELRPAAAMVCTETVWAAAAQDRTGFSKRLWRLREGAQPAAALLLMPDEVRLRHARRLLAGAPFIAYLALERDAASAGAGAAVWRTPSGAALLDLRTVLDHTGPRGPWPDEEPPARASLPTDLDGEAGEDWMLPTMLKPVEKRALDLLSDWPWLTPAHLSALMG